jgi:LEA14-like dessication related protein
MVHTARFARLNRIFGIATLTMLAAFAVGCDAVNLKRPTAAITAMNVANVDTTGFTMNFDLDVSNPNSVELPVGDIDYTLGLGGVKVVEGKARPEKAVPANGRAPLRLPVTLTYENLLAAGKALRAGGGDVPYAIDSEIRFGSGVLGGVTVPVKYSGTLKLKELLSDPTLLLRSPTARKLADEVLGSIFGR